MDVKAYAVTTKFPLSTLISTNDITLTGLLFCDWLKDVWTFFESEGVGQSKSDVIK